MDKLSATKSGLIFTLFVWCIKRLNMGISEHLVELKVVSVHPMFLYTTWDHWATPHRVARVISIYFPHSNKYVCFLRPVCQIFTKWTLSQLNIDTVLRPAPKVHCMDCVMWWWSSWMTQALAWSPPLTTIIYVPHSAKTRTKLVSVSYTEVLWMNAGARDRLTITHPRLSCRG
jgi:hypothetical protein